MNRRLPALVVTVVGLIAVAIVGASSPAPDTPVFAETASPWMPAVLPAGGLTESWFCPGVPATGEEGVGGELVLANRTDAAVGARVELLGEAGAGRVVDVEVPAWGRSVVDVDAALTGGFVAAVVEVTGGGVVVEQRALHPAGTAVSPCANSTSTEWHFADGFTVGGSVNQIVLSNPFDDKTIVDVTFATADGSRSPQAFRGFPIAARSVAVLDFGVAGAGAQGEELLAVSVTATRGRLVAGRAQHFLDGGRLGYTMTLGAPALRDQWWFADGAKGPSVSERFSLYNPTDDEVEVDAIFLGVADFAEVPTIVVPAQQVVAFDPGAIATLGEGPHSVVFSTLDEPSIVVERALTRIADRRPSTSVVLGAPPRSDGYVASTWYLAVGASSGIGGSLVLYNVDNVTGTVTVEAIGPSGPVPIPGLESVAIAPAARIEIPLDRPEMLDTTLVVRATSRILVERSLTSGDGRSASWALPEG
jgi:Family of unknown function (DUF5719)